MHHDTSVSLFQDYLNKAKTKYMCGSGRPTVPNFDAQP